MKNSFPEIKSVGENIGFPNQSQLFASISLFSIFKSIFKAAFHALSGINGNLSGNFVWSPFSQVAAGTGVKTFGIFTHNHKINFFWSFVFNWGINIGIKNYRAKVDVLIKRES